MIQCSDNMFCQIVSVSLSLHCTRSAAAYKIYRTSNNRAQPDRNRELCPIIDHVIRPLLPSGVPNGEDSKLCDADGWMDEGWEHVTGTLLKSRLAKSPAVFTWSSIIDPFIRT